HRQRRNAEHYVFDRHIGLAYIAENRLGNHVYKGTQGHHDPDKIRLITHVAEIGHYKAEIETVGGIVEQEYKRQKYSVFIFFHGETPHILHFCNSLSHFMSPVNQKGRVNFVLNKNLYQKTLYSFKVK